MMNLVRMTALILAVAMLNVANAAAFKCVATDGKVSFSDTPCPASTAKGEKIMDRGAGYNHLNKDEKRLFNAGIMSRCNGPRDVCACLSDYMSDELSYEEVMQYSQHPKTVSSGLQEKADKAMKYCFAMKSR